MRKALLEAEAAMAEGEIPIGAVIVCQDHVIARAHNLTETLHDVTAHAEMQAITAASSYLGAKYLNECTLYVPLEPCVMCAGAIAWTRLDALYYGAGDPKTGAIEQGAKVFSHPQTHHKIKIEKWDSPECGQIMTQFFKGKRSS